MPLGADWMHTHVHGHLFQSAETNRRAVTACGDAIVRAAQLIADAFRSGNKLLLCGNGGSAADCQHMAAEFVSRLTRDFERPGMPAVALTTDTSFLTAFANDCGFDGVFARQVAALGKAGDVLIGISTSGASANIIRAVEAAHAREMRTVALTGCDGPLALMTTVAIAVPSSQTQHVQETHLAIEHILCHLVEREVYGLEPAHMIGEPADDY